MNGKSLLFLSMSNWLGLAMPNYEFDEENGIIRDKLTGERCFIVHEKTMENIFNRLEAIFKSGIEVLLNESSRAASKHAIDLIEEKAKTDANRFLTGYTTRFAQVGFGRIEVCEFKREEGKITFRVWNSLFAEMRHEKSPYCSYLAGLLSGIYEGLLHKTPKVKEMKCIGDGAPYCEFLLTPKVA